MRPRPSYAERFRAFFPARAQSRPLQRFATVSVYDERYFTGPPARLSNDEGDMAWRTAYRMASLNEMYRSTRDPKYLRQNLAWAARVMEARDDIRGQKRWNGKIGPVWSCEAYGVKGRAAYAVHTAMITYPILDLLILRGKTQGEYSDLLAKILESLDAHDVQWRDGPLKGEGYYVYTDEQDPALAGKPLPINRSNAMAKSLWLAWKLSHDSKYRRKALAVGRFFKNRLRVTAAGGYAWPYEVPLAPEAKPRSAEDSSHGALTASLAPLLAADGEIFDSKDLDRFAATVVDGVTLPEPGMISGDVEGSEKADPAWIDQPARWLEFAPYHRAIYPRIARYYESYDADTSPDTASLTTALLIRYRPRPSR